MALQNSTEGGNKMRRKKSWGELKKLLEKRFMDCIETLEVCKGNENPQVRELCIRKEAEAQLIKHILNYIKTGERWGL